MYILLFFCFVLKIVHKSIVYRRRCINPNNYYSHTVPEIVPKCVTISRFSPEHFYFLVCVLHLNEIGNLRVRYDEIICKLQFN